MDPEWQWIFDFEYKPENAELSASIVHQYTKTPLYEQYQHDFDIITQQIRTSNKAKYFDYTPQAPIVVKETGKLPNGKRFGTGTVGGLNDFAERV